MNDESEKAETGWQPIETAPWCKCCPPGKQWLDRCLLAKERKWGWAIWVGECDAGIWLCCNEDDAFHDTDAPTHWMPLLAPPEIKP